MLRRALPSLASATLSHFCRPPNCTVNLAPLQVVIVLSFTTIIGLMISTFFFVLGTGAIHFNDQ